MSDKESIYFYIDESGTLDTPTDNDRFFILSCYATNTPDIVKQELNKLMKKIQDELYFDNELHELNSTGFHACDNHPDIRAEYYRLLYKLNIRIYALILDKQSATFQDLKKQHENNEGVYIELLQNLLNDRLIRNRSNYNVLTFEEYGSKPQAYKSRIKTMIESIIKKNNLGRLSYKVEIATKSNIMLSAIDYVNYVLYQMLHKESKRVCANFQLIEPQIALLHHLDRKIFYSEKKRINFDEIKSQGDL